MESLIYVMIPSLMAFHVIFFTFYALHSYTADQKAFDRKTIVKKWTKLESRWRNTSSDPSNLLEDISKENIKMEQKMDKLIQPE